MEGLMDAAAQLIRLPGGDAKSETVVPIPAIIAVETSYPLPSVVGTPVV